MKKRFGKWTWDGRTKKLPPPKYKFYYWCRCTCGKEKWVYQSHLLRGKSTACRACSNLKHGASRKLRDPLKYPTLSAYNNMLSRCYNPSSTEYIRYSSRGITVCSRWRRGFKYFLQDMGWRPAQNLSLDRIDNNKGYSKENCRWTTSTEQQNNTTYNRRITYQGRTQSLAKWSREVGIGYMTLSSRLKLGWPIHRAFTESPDWSKK